MSSEDGLKIVENNILIGYLDKMWNVWESVKGEDDSDSGKSSPRCPLICSQTDILVHSMKTLNRR